ncbi:PTS sugar transporter subunit IIA [Spiroplasma sp. DGKH1]|uniref:PTS sugar transporter subunit IIA n=1 Tax=Spiroplasma sp. DGKH1 TaxID=3050074 RepID=UPI0034C64C2F
MMKLFNKKLINYTDQPVSDWQTGVHLGSQLLINHGYVTPDFPTKVIKITDELGPYYVIAPQLALLHINVDPAILKTGISFTYFKNPIIFKDEPKYHVNFCLALAAVDGNSHMGLLQAVATLFTNQQFLQELKNCSSQKELVKIIKKYDK